MTALIHGVGDYSYYYQLLRGDKPTQFLNDMQPGFYRRSRSGIDDAVSIFWQGPELICTVNGKKHAYPVEVWHGCGDNAVTHEDYLHRIKHGRWPNDHEMIAKSNRPPADNSMEAVVAQLDALEHEAKNLIKQGAALSQNEADRASDIANSIAEIEKKTIGLHKVEKEPHLKAGRAVDTRWFPLRDRACNLKSEIKRIVVTPFLVKLRRDADAELERARELGVEQFMEQDKIGAGSLKRTVALRTKVTAKIVDYDALIQSIKDNTEVRELAQRLADASCRATGIALPGTIKIETEIAT